MILVLASTEEQPALSFHTHTCRWLPVYGEQMAVYNNEIIMYYWRIHLLKM